MKVKICGITNLDDALIAVDNGAWALGFNFYPASPRYILPAKAREISAQLPKGILKIGILIAYSQQEILAALDFLDLVQIYQPDPLLPHKKRIILSLQSAALAESAELNEYGFILLDAPQQADGLLGGTGRIADWDLARKLAKKYRLILAGGLNLTNIVAAINYVQPWAVDVASGIEQQPGIKNPLLIKEFLARCKNVN